MGTQLFNSLAGLLGLTAVIFISWRLNRIRRFERDERIFVLFFLWPAILCVYQNFLPSWRMSSLAYDGVYLLGVVAMLVDFVYYFGLISERKFQQMVSLVLILPCLAFSWRGEVLKGETVTLPHYGRALVWTEGLFEPRAYYFFNPETTVAPGRKVDDLNYGQAIFSPLSGVVESFEADMIILRRDDLRLAIGPIMEGSARVDAGDAVFENQPIGLQGDTQTTPGIRVAVRSNHRLRFADVLSGRLLAGEYKAALLKRNMLVQSQSPTRFRVETD